MAKQKYVLDTNVFISLVKGLLGTTPAASLPVDGKIYISVITRVEALAYPQMTDKEEEKIRAVLRYIHVIPLNKNTVTGQYCCRYRYCSKSHPALQ
jgi:predicted nucleic acid-binding protein